MRDKERVQRKIEAIKHMDDPLEAVAELADITFDGFEDACIERAEIRKLSHENRVILKGNGTHENSVVYRLGETIRVQTEMKDSLCKIEKGLLGDIDDPTSISLIEQVRSNVKFIASFNKVTWVIISTFLGQLALFIWAFVINSN